MKSLSINGKRLNYFEKNPDQPNSVMFIHGNSHSMQSFAAQMNSPLLDKYHLVFIDLPGHGDSEKAETYSLKYFGEIIGHIVQALSLKNVLFVGHSLGGHIAINALSKVNPSGLFIFGTPPLKNPFDPNAFLPNPHFTTLGQATPTDLDLDMLMNEMGYLNEDKKIAVEQFRKADGVFRQTILNDVVSSTHQNEALLLKTFSRDTMFLLATNDRLINNEYIRTVFHVGNQSMKFSEIESGHCPQTEVASVFNHKLVDFCESVFNKNTEMNLNSEYQHKSGYHDKRN